MAFQLGNRIKETSTTTGSGTIDLDGASTGFETFVDGIGTTNTCYYTIEDGTNWEVGLGTVTSGSPDTLSRDTVLASSNSDAKVNWGAGTRDVYCVAPAERLPILAAALAAGDAGKVLQVNTAEDQFELAGPLMTSRNALINGNFNVWQRGTSFTGPANGSYAADRWIYGTIGAGVVDIKQETTTLPDGTVDIALSIDVTTADASIAAGDSYTIAQNIEGYNAVRFALGTADAKEITLSFWVYAKLTGIHCAWFRNSANNRSYVSEYTIVASNTWEKKTITLTGDTSGTWLTTNGVGLKVGFSLAGGTDFHGTNNTWEGANDLATSNQVNSLDPNGDGSAQTDAFMVSQVQLELGGVATPFEHEDFSVTLQKCQRYYAKTFSFGTAPVQNVGTSAGALTYFAHTAGVETGGVMWRYPVRMRDSPTLTFYNPLAANALWRNTPSATDSAAVTENDKDDASVMVTNVQVGGDLVGERMNVHAQAVAEI